MEDGSDMIEFTISAKVPQGFWAGIAFSQDTNMVENNTNIYKFVWLLMIGSYLLNVLQINSDAVVGWVNSDTPVLSDRYLSSKALLGVAADDTPKNVNLKSGSYKDGMLMFKFTRDRTTTVRANYLELRLLSGLLPDQFTILYVITNGYRIRRPSFLDSKLNWSKTRTRPFETTIHRF